MSTVLPVEGAVLQHILLTTPQVSPADLSGSAAARFDSAVSRVPWAQRHMRRWALMDGHDVLASAQQYNLTGILDRQAVRVCGIGQVFTDPAHRGRDYASSLVERLLDEATSDGVEIALLFGNAASPASGDRFAMLQFNDVELTVAESPRHGAPMVLVRGGEDRDLAAIVAMGRERGAPFRFHIDRDAELVKYAITKRRLRAGLGAAGVRELQFVIAEEGITAAAYLVISTFNGTWTIEECGDRDPSGARVGAILQSLIAREPAERRPVIRGWLPPGFLPPQVTIASSTPSNEVMMTRFLTPAIKRRRLVSADVMYWRSDLLC